jgi:secreted trypsin-like serine protease
MEIKTLQAVAGMCTAATLAIATPSYAQKSPSGQLPYDAASSRVQGQKPGKQIWFGQAAPKGLYPFMVALIQAAAEDNAQGNYEGQFCGGSLIADRWVVTAGHCVTGEDEDKRKIVVKPEDIDIYAGSTDFKDGARIKVKRVIRHPDYNGDTYDNDVALLELVASAKSDKTAFVGLVTLQDEIALSGVGKKVIAAGWGETEKKDEKPPTDLMHVEMDVLDGGMCNANILNYRKAENLMALLMRVRTQLAVSEGTVEQVRLLIENNLGKVVTDNMICSGRLSTQRDTCQGDSGGPLMAKGEDGKFVLVGLTSWGELCGQSERGLYGIYTRVAKFSDWIKQNTQ